MPILLAGTFASGAASPITAVEAADSPNLIGVSATTAARALSILPTMTGISATGVSGALLEPSPTLQSSFATAVAQSLPYLYTTLIGVSAFGNAALVTTVILQIDYSHFISVVGLASSNIVANPFALKPGITGVASKNIGVTGQSAANDAVIGGASKNLPVE